MNIRFTFVAFILILSLYIIYCQEIFYYPSGQELERAETSKRNHQRTRSELGTRGKVRNFNAKIDGNLHKTRFKKLADPTFYGHPKTKEEMWHEKFLSDSKHVEETKSLIKLLFNITSTYLRHCTPVLLYDKDIKADESFLLKELFENFPISFVHGDVDDDYKLIETKLLNPVGDCASLVIFVSNVKQVSKIIGKQSVSKVIVVARSSQWAVQEFLSDPLSQYFVNLLVIGQSFKEKNDNVEAPFILYTHSLYIDGLGASRPQVLCSWSHGKFSRNVNLFPPKMTDGYAGHRFVVAAANQPPFVFRRIVLDQETGVQKIIWDGVEVRILNLLAERNNFSVEIVEPLELLHLGPGDAVNKEVVSGRADIGVAGMYVTSERLRDTDMSSSHSQDCAAFITLTSTALPRYRAILGPFHWTVWLALTFTYMIAIFPLAFSDKHTLRHLLNNMGEVENMFWYVFGTFTNCFTFVGKNSWSKTTKVTTRLLIGWYWVFTIIITSCYTGSIIAFVTLPVFPETVDTIEQLLSGFYRVGTLDRGGWERWFSNSSDPLTNKLLRKMEFVPDIKSGISNITKAFFWPYAFIGSKAELEYLVQANFSKTESKRNLLHISNECFVPFGVSLSFPRNSVYSAKLSSDIKRMIQSGLVSKIVNEVRWEVQRSSSGKLLSVSSDFFSFQSIQEKGLTLEDTQGMFLLLGAGFLLAGVALVSELMGGFSRRCRKMRKRLKSSGNSNEKLISTPSQSGNSEKQLDLSKLPSSALSCVTDGEDNILEDDVTVHHHNPTRDFDSRTSSSVNLDREVEEIFKIDDQRRSFEENNSLQSEDGKSTVSKIVFG